MNNEPDEVDKLLIEFGLYLRKRLPNVPIFVVSGDHGLIRTRKEGPQPLSELVALAGRSREVKTFYLGRQGVEQVRPPTPGQLRKFGNRQVTLSSKLPAWARQRAYLTNAIMGKCVRSATASQKPVQSTPMTVTLANRTVTLVPVSHGEASQWNLRATIPVIDAIPQGGAKHPTPSNGARRATTSTSRVKKASTGPREKQIYPKQDEPF